MRKQKRKSNHDVSHDMDHGHNAPSLPKRRTAGKYVSLQPRNSAQTAYVKQLMNPDTRICVAVGPAGTGKSYLAVLRAIMALQAGEIDRIVITRPAVSVDEDHGFLPGDLNDKMAPWVRPVIDIFEEVFDKEATSKMILSGVIEIAPLAYMRGRTFKNCYIIAEELQNSTVEQFTMLTTRIGTGCNLIITGDPAQHDRGFGSNGLVDFLNKLDSAPHRSTAIKVAMFDRSHVERDPIVSEVLKLYGQE